MNNAELTTINMFDPTRDYKRFKDKYDSAIQQVLNSGKFINGPQVKEIEEDLAKYVGVKHCIGVGNGTDAIQIALMALGIGNSDEVITVSHTWISTVEMISIIGAKPVFVDIEKDLFCMDVDKIEREITERTKAILVVSLYGQTPDYDRINDIACKYGLPVIEDGAQSFGAEYKGRKSCGLTTIGTTSFFPTKPLGCYGDGGACFTNDDELGLKMRAIKNHGGTRRFHHTYIGMNSRLDTLQAAVLKVKLWHFDETILNRNRVAHYYNTYLKVLEDGGLIKLPVKKQHNEHVWAQYSILMSSKEIRDKTVDMLKDKGVNVSIFYPKPVHTQKCFDYLNYEGELPNTNEVCNRIINLPCYGELTDRELEYIVKSLKIIAREMSKT